MDFPTCFTCPYWRGRSCHRHAPRPNRFLPAEPEGSVDFAAYWPETEPDQSCGDHPDFPAYIASRASITFRTSAPA